MKHKRLTKLAKPKLQRTLVLKFAGIAALGLLLQYLLLSTLLFSELSDIPKAGAELNGLLQIMLAKVLVVSLGVLIPVLCAVGTLMTFRFAGPIRNFENYFQRVANGEDVGRCSIRAGDELQELCGLINEAMDKKGSAPSDAFVDEPESGAEAA
ncbi:MAG: hypothetical protein ACI835_000977 [Planctomycetota bacterium]|jgi:hypothetical protein